MPTVRDAIYRKYDGPIPVEDAIMLQFASLGKFEYANASAMADHFTAECHSAIRKLRLKRHYGDTVDVAIRQQNLIFDLKFYRAQRNRWRSHLRRLAMRQSANAQIRGDLDEWQRRLGSRVKLSRPQAFILRAA
jgi:hypothetical protein